MFDLPLETAREPPAGQSGGNLALGLAFRRTHARGELARHIPRLEIIELVGQGGTGAVYKARQPTLDRLVAIKILPAEVATHFLSRSIPQRRECAIRRQP